MSITEVRVHCLCCPPEPSSLRSTCRPSSPHRAVNNVHSIYIVSGNEGAGRELVITKLLANKNNETLTVSKSLKINLPYGNKSNNMILSTINYEIEGVHVIDESTLYVGISEAGVKGNKNNAYLLSISRSNF